MPTDFWSLASEPAQSKAGPAQENPFLGKLEIIGRVFCGGRGEDFFVVALFICKKQKQKQKHKDKYLLGAKCCARHLASNLNMDQSLLEGKLQSSYGLAVGTDANDETNRNQIN